MRIDGLKPAEKKFRAVSATSRGEQYRGCFEDRRQIPVVLVSRRIASSTPHLEEVGEDFSDRILDLLA